MATRESVTPATLRVEHEDEGLVVEYLDGRRTVYRQDPEPTEPPLRLTPERLVQILHTDPDQHEGVLVYVNDRDTTADILEESGVGRVTLAPNEEAVVMPGITVTMDGHAPVLSVEFDAIDGELYVFSEGHLGSAAYRLLEEAP